MDVAMTHGMRELTAAEILMISGGDGGESDSGMNWLNDLAVQNYGSWQEANWIGVLGRAAIDIFRSTPLNQGEDAYLRGYREALENGKGNDYSGGGGMSFSEYTDPGARGW